MAHRYGLRQAGKRGSRERTAELDVAAIVTGIEQTGNVLNLLRADGVLVCGAGGWLGIQKFSGLAQPAADSSGCCEAGSGSVGLGFGRGWWRPPEWGPLLPTMTPTRDQILAASAGWVAVLLNVLPGLGAGYLYQRRWKAYWITSALATTWFVAGAVLSQNAVGPAEARNQLVGLVGLLVLVAVSASEAGLAVKRVRHSAPR
jgi:hypothetical protein